MAPSRIIIHSSPSTLTIVEATTALVSPASSTRCRRSPNCSINCGALVQAGEPERFALVPVIGPPTASMISVVTFEFAHREILGMIIEGDDACVRSRLRIRYVPKNESFTSDVVDLFKFKDGKIAELVEFADTALVKQITS